MAVTYKQAGVDIDLSDQAKQEMAETINKPDPRVLNKLGAFASLVRLDVSKYKKPVMVLKMEEPGSKQLLAFAHGYEDSLAYDLVNHLINDLVVMGAEPIAILDCIVCGQLEKDKVVKFVKALGNACREQGVALVGGETSIQPGVLDAGRYVLSASLTGIVDEDAIVDGVNIKAGDVVLALASNGLHTNGYTLVRKLLSADEDLAEQDVEGETFLDAIMRPHLCYYPAIQAAMQEGVVGMAHITGGGVDGNLGRILPKTVDADVDLSKVQVPAIFDAIQKAGSVPQDDMWRTFNMGVGLVMVVRGDQAEAVQKAVQQTGVACYSIGHVVKGSGQVNLKS